MNFPYEQFESEYLRQIDYKINGISEMTSSERFFLNGMIRKIKPKKILEIGVAGGGSSAIILNAIKDDPDAHLYSIDFAKHYYRDSSKEVGFIVYEEFKTFLPQYTLFKDILAASCLDEIGNDIDFCLLDTTHCLPGEIIEYLTVLPYMKKNGIIVIHDTALHTVKLDDLWSEKGKFSKDDNFAKRSIRTGDPLPDVCCILFSCIKGEKIEPIETEHQFQNIGAVRLANDAICDAESIFNLLTLPWAHMPYCHDDLKVIEKIFKKNYPESCVNKFLKATSFNADLAKYRIQLTNPKLVFRPPRRWLKANFPRLYDGLRVCWRALRRYASLS